MNSRDDLHGKQTEYLERRKAKLLQKQNDPRRLKKGKATLSAQEQEELALLSTILEERLLSQRQTTRSSIQSTIEIETITNDIASTRGLFAEEKQRDNFGTLHKARKYYEAEAENIVRESKGESLTELGAKMRQFEWVNAHPKGGHPKMSRLVPHVIFARSESEVHGELREGVTDNHFINGYLKPEPISSEWAGITYIRLAANLNGNFENVGPLVAEHHQFREAAVTKAVERAEFESVEKMIMAMSILAETDINNTLAAIRREFHLYDTDGIIDLVKTEPQQTLTIIKKICKHITRKPPRSFDEAWTRVESCLAAIEHNSITTEKAFIGNKCRKEVSEIAKNWQEQIAHRIPLEGEAEEILEILSPDLLNIPHISQKIVFARQNEDSISFIFKRDSIDEKLLTEFINNVHEETLDLAGELDLDTNIDWISGSLPSLKALEGKYLAKEEVEGQFLLEPIEDDELKRNKKNSETSSKESLQKQLPKLKTLRNLLLRHGIAATFTWDCKGSEQERIYSKTPLGHYVVVTIGDLQIQIIVSDDNTKGSYVIYNTIDLNEFTRINPKDLRDRFGGTPIKWDSAQQWSRSIQNTLNQQAQERLQIYPINTNYPSPLDQFPSEESLNLLRTDFHAAAIHAGKQDAPWTLLGVDFEKIQSGEQLWIFGGNANGGIYLDRIAREFELRGSEIGEDQYVFRRLILKMLLYEIFPEYRNLQEERDRAIVNSKLEE